MSYYIRFADHLLKAKGEEVFRRMVQEGLEIYLDNRRRKMEAEEKEYEQKKREERMKEPDERMKELEERMKRHKDIL